MDGHTLESVLRRDPHAAPLFVGVFASDTLPHSIHTKPALIIVNTDPIQKPGAHWQLYSFPLMDEESTSARTDSDHMYLI